MAKEIMMKKVNQLADKYTSEKRIINREGDCVEVGLEKLVSYEEEMTQYEIFVGKEPIAIAKKFMDKPDFIVFYDGITSKGNKVDHKIKGCGRITSILNRVTDIYINGFVEMGV